MNTAVILTARKENDSDIPYPLKPFCDGVRLLDRTLEILRSHGFQNIIIVVGYRHEMFEKYQANDVQMLVNPDFEFTASMGSLAICEQYINNDLILIEGDTFFEKDVISKLSSVQTGNCIIMTQESGSGDECFVETKNGFVTKITKDRHRVCNFEGEMIGISRI